jgi:hypothetical protein
MAWTTRSLSRAKEYVVLQHRLADMNGNIAGVKFRGGYCVVEKGSKSYISLKQLPLLKGGPEFPLIHLRKLKFITRTADVKMVFGQDVYYQYIKELNAVLEAEKAVKEEQAEEAHVEAYSLCAHKTAKGSMCQFPAMEGSPSKYCKMHVLNDPKLVDLGIELPSKMTKEEKKKYKDIVIAKLERK